MMADEGMAIEEEAIRWVVRLRDGGADDWEDFTLWLEADPDHLAAYEEAALTDAGLDELAPPTIVTPPVEQHPIRIRTNRRAFLGWGIAAAIAGMIGYGALRPAGADLYAVETGAGQRRAVELADGSRIDLNGATRVMLDRGNARFARLDRGEALFTIVHNTAQPFEVEAGDAQLRDMGTVFNVTRYADRLDVGVVEGAVVFNPRQEAVNLTAGMTISSRAGAAPVVGRAEPAIISGWREGRLTYSAAPIAQVAQDLSRNLGVQVTAGTGVAARSFTGIIQLDADAGKTIGRAAPLMGLAARGGRDGWMLTTGASETR